MVRGRPSVRGGGGSHRNQSESARDQAPRRESAGEGNSDIRWWAAGTANRVPGGCSLGESSQSETSDSGLVPRGSGYRDESPPGGSGSAFPTPMIVPASNVPKPRRDRGDACPKSHGTMGTAETPERDADAGADVDRSAVGVDCALEVVRPGRLSPVAATGPPRGELSRPRTASLRRSCLSDAAPLRPRPDSSCRG